MSDPRTSRTPRPIVILGPTAGGKSELAVMLAERLRGAADTGDGGGTGGTGGNGGNGGTGGTGGGGEIIGADSMQIYRHLDAGTAKPTPSQRARVPHHLIDLVEPTERFTVADWLSRADAMIESLQSRSITPIVVGGTNLYIKALLEGMFEGPPIDEALRDKLNATDLRTLRVRLEAVDPQAAARIHPNDRKRTVRALEVFEQTGQRISELQTQWEGESGIGIRESGIGEEGRGSQGSRVGNREEGAGNRESGIGNREQGVGVEGEARMPSPELRSPVPSPQSRIPNPESRIPNPQSPIPRTYRHDPMLIGLAWAAEAINPRINLRVKAMFFPHLVPPEIAADVVPTGENLVDETRRLSAAGLLGPQACKALGYQQVLEYLGGKCSLDDAFERTKILTRQYAKSQRTWLKRYRGVHWIEAENRSKEMIADEAMRAIELEPGGRSP